MRHTANVLVAASVAAGCVAPAGIAAQVPTAGTPRVIQVNASATVQRAPDRAAVQIAVETLAETAGEATAGNAATMERVLVALRQLGIPDSHIQTARIELHPRYDHRRDGTPPVIVGYQAVNQVGIRLDDIDLVGRAVDAAVQAGANRVTGVRFELSEPDAAYHDALREAVARARAEAQVVAAALDETLGPALQVSTGGGAPPPIPMRMEAFQRADMAADTPVQPGELDVHATVSITYRLGS